MQPHSLLIMGSKNSSYNEFRILLPLIMLIRVAQRSACLVVVANTTHVCTIVSIMRAVVVATPVLLIMIPASSLFCPHSLA
jgi:hypothetical protein